MEVLKPPTDTLYKFLAILGLLLFVSSVVSPIWLNQRLAEQQADLIHDLKVVNLEAKIWQEDFREVEKAGQATRELQDRVEEMIPKVIKGEVSFKTFEELLQKTRSATDTFDEKSKKWKQSTLDWYKQNAQVDYKESLLNINTKSTNRMLNLTTAGAVVGLVLAIVGFALWYRRTQRYEDLILKQKIEAEPPSKLVT